MVRRKKKKSNRQRGSRSHGWGKQKDHKGKGMQGGAGNAGTMTHRYIQVVKQEKAGARIIGKYGFKRPQKRQYEVDTINVSHLDQSILTLVDDGDATVEGDTYIVDLTELGIEKLLAQGNVHKKMEITVEKASSRAISKVEEAGGSVELTGED